MWSNRSLVKRRFLLAFWLLYLKPVLKYTVWKRNTEWSHGHWNACWDDKCNLLRILHIEENGLIFLLTQNLSYNMSICKFFFSFCSVSKLFIIKYQLQSISHARHFLPSSMTPGNMWHISFKNFNTLALVMQQKLCTSQLYSSSLLWWIAKKWYQKN